jgi:hypothetical protein
VESDLNDKMAEVFVETVQKICEAADVDPQDVAAINWIPHRLVITKYKTNEDGLRYNDDNGFPAVEHLEFPGQPV